MPFELPTTIQVACVNANPRTEMHGTELVRAIDLSFKMTGENTLLDRIQPGLREHHFTNNALKDGQEQLPGVLIPLPNLRFPRLPLAYNFAKGEKWRGYRWIWDWGIDGAHMDFTDAVLSNLHYELMEGGSCNVLFTVQYNGDELNDNEIYGELAGLAAIGDVHMQLLAPVELLPAKKGYRAGKPDTQPVTDVTDKGGDLLGGVDEGGAGSADGDDSEEDTPEKALRRAHGAGEAVQA